MPSEDRIREAAGGIAKLSLMATRAEVAAELDRILGYSELVAQAEQAESWHREFDKLVDVRDSLVEQRDKLVEALRLALPGLRYLENHSENAHITTDAHMVANTLDNLLRDLEGK